MATMYKLVTFATLAALFVNPVMAQEKKLTPVAGIGSQITCGEYLAPGVSMAVAMQLGQWLLGFWSGLDTMRSLEKKATVGAVGQDTQLETKELKRICSEHPGNGIPSAALDAWVRLLVAEGKNR